MDIALDTPVIGEDVDPDAWKEIVDLGVAAVEKMDTGRWILGDLGLMVKANYGEDEFGQFCHEIKIEQKRAAAYRTLARYYPKEMRDARCNYSLHKIAMRLNDVDRSAEMLNEAAMGNWSVKDMIDRIKEDMGEPVPSSPITLILTIDARGVVTGVEGDMSRVRAGRWAAVLREEGV